MSKNIKDLSKGNRAEEILRHYFIRLGYYVVRSVEVKYQNVDITDIDLLLYKKNSIISKERINVDVKDKKSPHAVERIFWTKGIQNNLELDNCIVATSDKRAEITDYGKKQGVIVLDGNFLSDLKGRDIKINRISEEHLKTIIDEEDLSKFLGNWWKRYEISKSRLIFSLNFTGFNKCLEDIRNLFEEIVSKPTKANYYFRFLYLFISHSLIIIDYLIGSIPFLDEKSKQDILDEGFQHGTMGKARTEKIISIVEKIVRKYLSNGSEVIKDIRDDMKVASDEIPVEILSEYFSDTTKTNHIFELAKKFELLGFQKEVIHPDQLDNGLKGLIGLYLDFNQIPRKDFFEVSL